MRRPTCQAFRTGRDNRWLTTESVRSNIAPPPLARAPRIARRKAPPACSRFGSSRARRQPPRPARARLSRIGLATAETCAQRHMLAALSEFERGRIQERVRAGLARARANGRRIGRPGHRVTAKDSRSHLTSEHPGSGQALEVSPALIHRLRSQTPVDFRSGDRTGNARVVAGHADRSQIIRFMNSKRRWTIAGWASTAIGAWMFVWGVSGLDEPGLPNRHLLYDAGYSKSLQAESIFLGVGLLMFGYLAFRHSRS